MVPTRMRIITFFHFIRGSKATLNFLSFYIHKMAHIVRNALNRNLNNRQTLDFEYMQGQHMYEEQIRRASMA